jgi:hypothetical protein
MLLSETQDIRKTREGRLGNRALLAEAVYFCCWAQRANSAGGMG